MPEQGVDGIPSGNDLPDRAISVMIDTKAQQEVPPVCDSFRSKLRVSDM